MSYADLLPERILSKFVVDPDGHWLWTAGTSGGYGGVHWDKKQRYAHRVVYELLVGPIPAGLRIDHLCRVLRCVNPDHLEPVTQRENIRRAVTKLDRTHCKNGHPWLKETVFLEAGNPRCRLCARDRQRRFQERRKAAEALRSGSVGMT